MNDSAIGVFDSGLGGLTAVREIINIMPNENIIYFGDTGRIPYGTRSKETIIKYVRQDINFLLTHKIKIIIAACGTASAVAIDEIKKEYDIDIIGVVEPAAVASVYATKNNKIGILGTLGTIKSCAYERVIKNINPEIVTVSNACPMFVPLVENGYLNSEATYIFAREYLKPLIDEKIDTIILGCTHYPLLASVISDIMGEGVTLIDPGYEVARYSKKILEAKNIMSSGQNTYKKYFVSDSKESFSNLGSIFLKQKIECDAEIINIEKY